MVLMTFLRWLRFVVAGQYGLPQHKPKGRAPVNTACILLQCGISLGKAVDWPDLPIEQLAGLG
jgi:hypothetical protein